MIITELSTLTKPQRYDAVMAGNIKVSTKILREVVEYNRKFSASLETEAANIEVECSLYIKYLLLLHPMMQVLLQSELDIGDEKHKARRKDTKTVAKYFM